MRLNSYLVRKEIEKEGHGERLKALADVYKIIHDFAPLRPPYFRKKSSKQLLKFLELLQAFAFSKPTFVIFRTDFNEFILEFREKSQIISKSLEF